MTTSDQHKLDFPPTATEQAAAAELAKKQRFYDRMMLWSKLVATACLLVVFIGMIYFVVTLEVSGGKINMAALYVVLFGCSLVIPTLILAAAANGIDQ